MKPNLSAKCLDTSKINYPVLCSPKLDGIRCLITEGGLPVTRTLKNVPNDAVREAIKRLRLPQLDGELIVGDAKAPDVYRKTNSGIMAKNGGPDWTYWVFDAYTDGGFQDRLDKLRRAVAKVSSARVRVVPHVMIANEKALLAYEADHLLAGFEGIMGRSLHATYKQGRSTMREGGLWKLKRFEDSEATILDFDEEMLNANEAKLDNLGHTKRSSHKANKSGKGVLGALKVRDVKSGVEFDIGTGFTAAERHDIWANRQAWTGLVVKYKYLPIGVKDKPRHPVYLGLRSLGT